MPNQYVNKVVQSNGTTLIDISDTTAVASDVAEGKYFYLATGEKVEGTSSGSGTAHTIYFEFSDGTDTTLVGYWNSSFISDAITATTPNTYGGKTVTLAELDGVAWYEPAAIPLNTQLVDYNAVLTGYAVDDDGNIIAGDPWNCITDYIPIDRSMTFSFICQEWSNIGFYNSQKTALSVVTPHDIADTTQDYFAFGTLDSSVIPLNAVYVVMVGNSYAINSEHLSLIRTA